MRYTVYQRRYLFLWFLAHSLDVGAQPNIFLADMNNMGNLLTSLFNGAT